MEEVDRLNKDYHGSPCDREQTWRFPRLSGVLWDQFIEGFDGHIDFGIDKNMFKKVNGVLCQQGVHGKAWYQKVTDAGDQTIAPKTIPTELKSSTIEAAILVGGGAVLRSPLIINFQPRPPNKPLKGLEIL